MSYDEKYDLDSMIDEFMRVTNPKRHLVISTHCNCGGDHDIRGPFCSLFYRLLTEKELRSITTDGLTKNYDVLDTDIERRAVMCVYGNRVNTISCHSLMKILTQKLGSFHSTNFTANFLQWVETHSDSQE